MVAPVAGLVNKFRVYCNLTTEIDDLFFRLDEMCAILQPSSKLIVALTSLHTRFQTERPVHWHQLL